MEKIDKMKKSIKFVLPTIDELIEKTHDLTCKLITGSDFYKRIHKVHITWDGNTDKLEHEYEKIYVKIEDDKKTNFIKNYQLTADYPVMGIFDNMFVVDNYKNVGNSVEYLTINKYIEMLLEDLFWEEFRIKNETMTECHLKMACNEVVDRELDSYIIDKVLDTIDEIFDQKGVTKILLEEQEKKSSKDTEIVSE
ncbi:MAG: hypothetical protein LBN09_05785 [Clostridioides sp.]|jgi:hypothetical protein|nr:hypothetical protein [Clostridioides sp.]